MQEKPKGKRFSDNDKVLALALLKQSGAAYKYLSDMFTSPTRLTITNFLNKINIRPGYNPLIFEALRTEVQSFKNELDKYCVLIFDEMPFAMQLSYNAKDDAVEGFDSYKIDSSEFANHAQVFMARGIRHRWKQPIFYNFSAGPTKCMDVVIIIKLLIRKLKDAGLIVCAYSL